MLESNPYTLIIEGYDKYNIMILTNDFKYFFYANTLQRVPTNKTRKVFRRRRVVDGIVGLVEGEVADGATTGLPIQRDSIIFNYNEWTEKSEKRKVKAIRVNEQYNKR